MGEEVLIVGSTDSMEEASYLANKVAIIAKRLLGMFLCGMSSIVRLTFPSRWHDNFSLQPPLRLRGALLLPYPIRRGESSKAHVSHSCRSQG
jgi:hypothetical protein